MPSHPGGGPLRILRAVSSALTGPGALPDRLTAAVGHLVPELADRSEVRLLGEATLPAPAPCVLEVPLAGDDGAPLGSLRLVRLAAGAAFAEPDRELVAEVAGRLAAAIQLEALRAGAAELASTHDEFLATMSHELRTPLNVVVGWVELLRLGKLAPDKQARALEIIDRNARVQARLMDDLLDASRMLAGRIRVEPRPLPIADLVGEAVEALRPHAADSGVALEVQLAGSPVLRADPERISQILHNLVGNAIKFTPAGGRVEVSLRVDATNAVLAVSDTGSGISADLLPLIFERFFQGERKRLGKTRGLGLGLFIARHLARLHGGDILAESDGPGRGARFTVRLPLAGPPHT